MAMSTALIFPGQGSQKKGMGIELLETSRGAAEILERAESLASFPLRELLVEDPRNELNLTKFTQPALFLVSAMYLEKIREEEVDYKAVAGHSLGEYSALYAAGVVTFDDGFKLVLKRGELMNQVNDPLLGMAALLGADPEAITGVVNGIEDLYVANLNSPQQTVVSGTKAALAEAEGPLKAAGVKRIFPLKVSGAFHSPYMAPVKEAFQEELKNCPMVKGSRSLYPNILAKPLTDAEEIRSALMEQMTGQVRWTETILNMKEEGITKLVECGPGKVLSGLVAKIDRSLECSNF